MFSVKRNKKALQMLDNIKAAVVYNFICFVFLT